MSGKLECFTVSCISILSIKVVRFQTDWDRFVRLDETNVMVSTVLGTVGNWEYKHLRAYSVNWNILPSRQWFLYLLKVVRFRTYCDG